MKKQYEQPVAYLRDMLYEMGNIREFMAGIKSSAELSTNKRSLYACVRSFEIMGEAAKHLPVDFIKKHSGVPWREMMGMRDKLIHDYGGVDADVVWKTIYEDLPGLKAKIERIIKK